MNNAFYTITDYLLKTAEEVELVNTVVFAQSENKDLYKNNLHPLVHVNPQLAPLSISNGSNAFTFEIGILDKRIEDNASQDKKSGNYNIIDTFSTTSAIMNEYISQIILNIGSEFIVSDISDATPIYYADDKGLDGWVFTLTIEIANKLELC